MACAFDTSLPWEYLWGIDRRDRLPEELAEETLSEWGVGVRRQTSSAPPATVHNIVSTSLLYGHTDQPIDLQQLANFLPCSSYCKRRFAAITLRMNEPKFTCLLFTSGKLVVTGVKSWLECLLAALCMSRLINKTLPNVHFDIMNCTVENIVAHAEMGLGPNQRLDIQALYENNSIECTYQVSNHLSQTHQVRIDQGPTECS